jgi:hypothetical protein
MKKAIILLCLFILFSFDAHGQWYVNKYEVTDIDYLTQQQLEESIKDTRGKLYTSLACIGIGGVVVLMERLVPYKLEDDDNVTLAEDLLGEEAMHKIIIAGGVGVSIAGTVASIAFLGRLVTIRSALNRNFPVPGSLCLSPSLIMDRTSHNLCPGVTLTFNF